ncbi:MAG: transposase [Dehalococcoidia bacterium]|nr:transposase [Dehalococcoidia bacterium]
MAKLAHFGAEDQCYFITTTTQGRKPVFVKQGNALILWSTINNQRQRDRFYLLGFVIMPDHLHLLIIPRGENKISFIMQEIKKGSARLINKSRKRMGKVWMDEYYDHVVRSKKGLAEKMRYMHHNPVKKGLVENEEEHPFSSANPEYERFLFKEW